MRISSSGDSVAVNGQTGTTNPFAGVDFGAMRDNAELNQSLNGAGQGGRRPGGGGRVVAAEEDLAAEAFGGGGAAAAMAAAFAATSATSKPNQPHGAIFWNGGNGALNAEDFALRGQSIVEPAYQSNRFGATVMTAPYIPKILTSDKRTCCSSRCQARGPRRRSTSTATVPTAAERGGDFTGPDDADGRARLPSTIRTRACRMGRARAGRTRGIRVRNAFRRARFSRRRRRC